MDTFIIVAGSSILTVLLPRPLLHKNLFPTKTSGAPDFSGVKPVLEATK